MFSKLYFFEIFCDEELDRGPNEEHDGLNDDCWLSGHCLQQNCTRLSVNTSDHAAQDCYYCLQIRVTSDYLTRCKQSQWLLTKSPNTDVYKRIGLGYYQVLWRGFHLFVVVYEEPTLRASYGVDYEGFCSNVPRWIPRLSPWRSPRRGGLPRIAPCLVAKRPVIVVTPAAPGTLTRSGLCPL